MTDWPRAVLFDFDGVIVNSEPLHFLAFNETLKHEGIELSERDYYEQLLGFDDKGAIKHLFGLRNLRLAPGQFLRILTHKGEVMRRLIEQRRFEALPGVEQFVRALWRHYPLAICSGALREEIETMLEGISLRDCFRVIVAAEDVTVGKPDPSGYLMTMQQVADLTRQTLRPQDCLIVEDAPTVVARAREAGFKTLAVANSYPMEKLAGADYRVKALRVEEVVEQVPGLRMTIG
jgi:beta-phosphoglucomutase